MDTATNRPWVAKHVVDEALARELIGSQFVALRPVHAVPLGVGWDNTAYRVNDRFVFRFPRRQIAVDLLQVESRVLPVIAGRLPLAVPVPTFLGKPAGGYPWPFAGYEMIPGGTADVAALDHDQRLATAQPLACFLAALHAFPADKVGELGAPGDLLGRLDPKKRVPMARENLAALRERGVIETDQPWLDMLDEVDPTRQPRGETLVHGDLYARHLLVDADARPTGVIDWGDLHIGDRAVDLSIAHGLLPPEAYGAFRAAYGPIDADTWRTARFRALYHASVTTLYGHETNDAALVREGLTVLRHVAESREGGV
ncbi:MAG: phosphotransferase [Phycisphaerae bacterium]|nr:phosphotransferase [Phycisphaerae bacterium]